MGSRQFLLGSKTKQHLQIPETTIWAEPETATAYFYGKAIGDFYHTGRAFSINKKMKQQRLLYLDNISALLIINMIFFCHQIVFCDYTNSAISFVGELLSFFMAWFFFKAGMMFKLRPVKAVAYISARRLLVPYVSFTFVGLVILACQEFFVNGNPLTFGFFKDQFWWLVNWSTLFPSMACWFLLSLFVVRVSYAVMAKRKMPPQILIGIGILVAWLVYELSVKAQWYYPLSVGSHHFQLHLPFYVGNIFHGLAFYALGAWLREKQFSRILFALATVVFVAKFFFPAVIDFRANDVSGDNYFLGVAYELSGCIVINNIFKYVANRPIGWLSYIGRNSMVYYLVHYPFMKVICYFFYAPFAAMSGEVRYLLLSGILVVFLFLSDFLFRNKAAGRLVGN